MLTVDEFEEALKMLTEKYNMKSHAYMTHIYEIRHKIGKTILFQDLMLIFIGFSYLFSGLEHVVPFSDGCDVVT